MTTEPISDLQEALQFIQENYVDRIQDFLSGKATRVVTNKEYMRIYDTVQHQCDTEDNNEALYDFFDRSCDSFIKNKLSPMLVGKSGDRMI